MMDDLSRRRFLSGAAMSLLGVGSLPLLESLAAAQDKQQDGPAPLRPATAKNVIYLFMTGGMTHLDTFDLKPGAATQGPTEALKTAVDGIQISSHLPNLARHMDKIAIINSLNSTQGAHAQGQYFMHTSYTLRGTIKHPTMGAWLNLMGGRQNPNLPGHVQIGGGSNGASAGFLESRFAPLPIGDPAGGLQDSARAAGVSGETFDRRLERAKAMNKEFAAAHDQKEVRAYSDMYDEAVRLMSSKDLEAFDLRKEPENLRQAYGTSSFGQGCLLARRLIENKVRFVEVEQGGWDTHNENFESMEEKLPVIDQALSALLSDLDSRGLLEETLVVLTTEFGRTPKIVTERMGRNHYPKAFSGLMAGGGIRGGQKYGKTDATGEEVVENKVSVPDFNATIAYALGLPLDHIVHSPSGRPFTVADKGKPVTALF
ncbi:MAG: DUF1501 domain-containing protein [Planctomycetes bacterium]|nr:DUF1501 domain-containing protein [Planctomycetota bacterium]